MHKRTRTKLSPSPNKPKRTFKTIQVRPEVLVLLSQVEDLIADKTTGIRPHHSVTFVNALMNYKARLIEQGKSLSHNGMSTGPEVHQ